MDGGCYFNFSMGCVVFLPTAIRKRGLHIKLALASILPLLID